MFIHSFNQRLLSTCYGSGTLLGNVADTKGALLIALRPSQRSPAENSLISYRTALMATKGMCSHAHPRSARMGVGRWRPPTFYSYSSGHCATVSLKVPRGFEPLLPTAVSCSFMHLGTPFLPSLSLFLESSPKQTTCTQILALASVWGKTQTTTGNVCTCGCYQTALGWAHPQPSKANLLTWGCVVKESIAFVAGPSKKKGQLMLKRPKLPRWLSGKDF